jgi:hypothetical protein
MAIGGVQVPGGVQEPDKVQGVSGVVDQTVSSNYEKEKQFFPNLVSKFSTDRLKSLGQQVVQGYLTDISSRSEWEDMQAQNAKMFSMKREPKTFPWDDCSNVGLPMLPMASVQYAARAFEELVPAKGIVKEKPFLPSADNIDIADRKSKYLNYNLMVRDTQYKRSMDASLLKQANEGGVVRKTFYDPSKGKVITDYINTTDFVINYNTRWLENSERYTHRLWLTENDIKIRVKNKSWENADKVEGTQEDEIDEVKQAHLSAVGLEGSRDKSDSDIGRRLILEQYILLDVSGKGGIKEPFTVTVDFITGDVVKVVSRKHPVTGETMECFTYYSFLPNPEGFYGYGFGLFLSELNEALNSITNQLIDAGTLQNLQTGFVLQKKGMERGDIELSMGKFTEIDPAGNDDIRKIITQFDFGTPSPVLFSMMGVLQTYADRFTTVTEQQTGNAQKSDTTATGVAMLIEQGLKFFSSIHRRNHMSLQQELEKIEKLTGLYLDVEEYFSIVMDPQDLINPETGDETPIEEVLEMLKLDFATTNTIVPVSNPNIISQQEVVARAQFVYDTTISSPATAQNMQAIYEAQFALYEALGVPDSEIQVLLPPPSSEEPPDLPQEEEIQMMMNEQHVEPLEQQDHQGHLKVMEEFEVSPFFEDMSPTGKKFFDAHKRAHLGFLYLMSAGQAVQDKADNQPPEPQQQEVPQQ